MGDDFLEVVDFVCHGRKDRKLGEENGKIEGVKSLDFK